MAATGPRYEVMYFLEAPDETLGAFKSVWAGIGDSIVVVGGDGLWNCHIHTDDIGAAVEAALDVGRPREIRVTDLLDQVEEESWVRRAVEFDAGVTPSVEEPAPVTSVVAVATGDGIRRIFYSLGVHHIVAGGQSMNPSTGQILEVVDSVPGAEVVILPNNKNIVPGRRAGVRALGQTGLRREHPRHPGGLRSPARVRPRGHRRGEREASCRPPPAGCARER